MALIKQALEPAFLVPESHADTFYQGDVRGLWSLVEGLIRAIPRRVIPAV